MKEEEYHKASHCKYLIQYHIIWCPKFRFSVLKGNVDVVLKQILQKICDDYRYHIKALEVMPDHIHIFVDVPEKICLERISQNRDNIEIFENEKRLSLARKNFLQIIETTKDTENVLIINGDNSVDEISNEIWNNVKDLF